MSQSSRSRPLGAVHGLRFHHVGVACRDIEPARRFVHATHTVVDDSGPVHDPLQDATVCLLECDDGLRIELVSGEAVSGLVRKGMTWYHNCYEVPDMAAAIASLGEARCVLAREPREAVLFGGRRVAFLYSPLGLIELLEAR